MKTTFTLLAFSAAAAFAQIPPPPGPTVAPSAATPTTNRPFFNRAGIGTNRPGANLSPAFPAAPGAVPAGPGAIPGPGTPGAAVPGAAVPGAAVPGAVPPGTAPGTTAITPRAGGTNAPVIAGGSIAAGMITFQETDLNQVLEFYADLTGRTILRSPQVPQNVKITLRNQTELSVQEGIDALNTMLSLNGIVMIEEGEKFMKAVPAASVPQEAAAFSSTPLDQLPEAKKVVAQIVNLKNITPEEATGIVTPFAALPNSIIGVKGTQVLILRDYAENVKRMLEIIEKVDIVIPTDIEMVVIPIKYAIASDVANVLGGLTAGGSTTTFGSSGASGLGGGFAPGSTGVGSGLGAGGFGNTGMGGGMNRMGGAGSYPGGGTFGRGGMNTMGSGLSGGNRSGFNSRVDSAVRRATAAAGPSGGGAGDIQLIGMAKIIADERSNALLVFADRRDLPMVTNIISKLDVVLPQVLIEALIMEVNLGSGQTLGVSMGQNPQQSGKLTTVGASQNAGFIDPTSVMGSFLGGGGTNTSGSSAPSGFSYFGKYGRDFDFAVQAAANDSRINVLSRPRIQTSTAQQANIFVGEQRPFITGSYFSDFSGAGSRSQYALQDIGISLSVQPIINQEGLVTMTIAQDISQVGGTTKIDNNDVPITITRTANAYVSVHDRDTIILGGFISTTKSKSTGGVPFLKDIPGLGMLFRSSSENIQRVELVVLIRPTVLPTPESAALEAAAEQERLPNIRRARREEEEFNQQQMEKARREEQRYEQRKY